VSVTEPGGGPPAPIPIFDGHNDTLLSLARTDRSFFAHGDTGHVDLPRARAGGLAGGFFAVFIPDPGTMPPPPPPGAQSAEETLAADVARVSDRYRDPATMPPPMSLEHAQRAALAMIARLFRLETAAAGAARVVRSAADLRACLADGVLAMELHLEGAEPIDPDLDALDVFYQAGLRSLGPVWSRPNRFAHGVPFGFPVSPDAGPGLTDLGQHLVRACNRLGVLIDLSHLNERGFWDVAALSHAPLVATHSNAHALCPAARNLTDKQLDAIRDSDGLVGVNFHVGFLRPDGRHDPDTPLALLADHVDYLVARLGPERVAFGSDFDGATMPRALPDAAALPRLMDELRARGYDDPTLRRLAHENWLRVLERTWGT
jgi:membrane dipeptidase